MQAINIKNMRLGFPSGEGSGGSLTKNVILKPVPNSNDIATAIQNLYNLEQNRLNLELRRQYLHEPDPEEVVFKYYADVQTGIGSNVTTPIKNIFPLDYDSMPTDGIVTHISVYTSGNVLGQTGLYTLRMNNNVYNPYNSIPVNTSSSPSLLKLPVPIEVKKSQFLQYSIYNNTTVTLDFFIIMLGYFNKGY